MQTRTRAVANHQFSVCIGHAPRWLVKLIQREGASSSSFGNCVHRLCVKSGRGDLEDKGDAEPSLRFSHGHFEPKRRAQNARARAI